MLKCIITIQLLLLSIAAFADGVVVDKVYHPYVLPNEREIEWRMMSRETDNSTQLGQRLGIGQSITENLTVEAYLVGEKLADEDYDLQEYEIELRWMMSDQGQYWADWGMLFELEKAHQVDEWEITTGILFEKEFGKASLAINLFAIYEWGNNIENEFESEFRLQYRYRYIAALQPAIEVYIGEDFFGIGPAIMGIHRFDKQKQLKWEAGFVTEVVHSGKDHTLRLALEYEF